MNNNTRRILKSSILAASALAGLMLASCAYQRSSPQQVGASNPTVTYNYRSDDELVQANQRAATFCDQYQAMPRTASISNAQDGSKVIVFECLSTSPSQPPQYNSNLSYTYHSDQELLDASRNAQMYCRSNGSHQVVANIVSNNNGTKTVTFRCQ